MTAVTVRAMVANDWPQVETIYRDEAYRGVVQHSIYIAGHAQGHGVGSALLDAFLSNVDAAGIWTVQATVFPENHASLALHERAGFRRIRHRERIGYMTYGPWGRHLAQHDPHRAPPRLTRVKTPYRKRSPRNLGFDTVLGFGGLTAQHEPTSRKRSFPAGGMSTHRARAGSTPPQHAAPENDGSSS
ncbi:N-acetyltransferase family protein [Microbacterium sp. F1-18]